MAIVQFRVDDNLKIQASSIYEKLGMDLSTAIRMFLKRSVMTNGIPFSMVLEQDVFHSDIASQAMKNMNETARMNGIEDMSLDEINAEISDCRKERHK